MFTSASILCFGGMRGAQLIIIIVLAIIVFGGATQIPKIMRNLGKGVHSFKQGIEDAKEEMNKPVVKYTPREENTKSETQAPAASAPARDEHPAKDVD